LKYILQDYLFRRTHLQDNILSNRIIDIVSLFIVTLLGTERKDILKGRKGEKREGGEKREKKEGSEKRERKEGSEKRERKEGSEKRERKEGSEKRERKEGGETRDKEDKGSDEVGDVHRHFEDLG
jgi:hypothetical protein